MRDRSGWRNWAGTVSAHPAEVARPRDTDEVARVIRAAADRGHRVKPVGSGHSFTAIAATDGIRLSMDRMRAIEAVDASIGRVTVQAGATLAELNRILDGHGLALSNLGDIDRQTIGGAISTGTHGTGARFTGLAAQVSGLRLVLADGSVVECSAARRPDLFDAARVGLGALGVIAAVTLECAPRFDLHARETPHRLDELLPDLDRLVADHDHLEFYWFPYTDRVLLKRNDRVPPTAAGEGSMPGDRLARVGRIRRTLEDELLGNAGFEALNRLATGVPRFAPAVNAVAAQALGSRDYVDRSYRVFCTSRRVVFVEQEYALPRATIPTMLAELPRLVRDCGVPVTFPVEVRFGAAEDSWLSLAAGRDTAYVAVHQYHRLPYEPYFRAVAEVADGLGGRPHWGKLHRLDAASLADRYPRFADFIVLRDELDPGRRFDNPYLRRVLGG